MGSSQGSRGEGLLPGAVAVLDDVLRYLRSRYRLGPEEAEEFGSLLKIKILDDDCAVLRSYRGDSSLRTYLSVVAQRLFLDYRVSQWGKWRPSAAARRAGPLGIELERLVRREGRTRADAIELLAARQPERVPRPTLEKMAEELRLEPSGPSAGHTPRAVKEPSARDSSFDRLEVAEMGDKVRAALVSAFRRFDDEDRLVIRMHYQDGLTLAAVSRALGLDQRELYRRLGALLTALRIAVEAAGVRRADVAGLLGRPDVDLSFLIETDGSEQSSGASPSNRGEP